MVTSPSGVQGRMLSQLFQRARSSGNPSGGTHRGLRPSLPGIVPPHHSSSTRLAEGPRLAEGDRVNVGFPNKTSPGLLSS